MAPTIDPASITHDNIPQVLGAMLVMMQDDRKLLDEIQATLKDHDDCLQIFKFSKCKMFPWLNRNKWVLAAMVAGVSAVDWLNLLIQRMLIRP